MSHQNWTTSPPAFDVAPVRRAVDALAASQREVPTSVHLARTPRSGQVPAMLRARPHGFSSDEIVIWLHGGSFVSGSLRSHERVAARLAHVLCRDVALIDYRLAPEHPFPAALQDTHAAIEFLRETSDVIIGGDSAGGGIAAAAASSVPGTLGALLLAYPLLDLRPPEQQDITEQHQALRACIDLYRGNHPPEHPALSPSLANPPPVGLIAVAAAANDPLQQQALKYAARATNAGILVASWVEPGTSHAFLVRDTPAFAVDSTLRRFRDALNLRPTPPSHSEQRATGSISTRADPAGTGTPGPAEC